MRQNAQRKSSNELSCRRVTATENACSRGTSNSSLRKNADQRQPQRLPERPRSSSWDCQDPQCLTDIHCQIENCQNGRDDNANGLVDCQDPQCFNAMRCQPETCNDEKDNNGDNLTDCDDPQCADSEFCVVTPKSSSESCAATPKSQSPMSGFALLAMIGASLGLLRRRRFN